MIDIDFQIESYQWVRELRGGQFMRHVQRSIERIGPTETAERIINDAMSDEEKEVYQAAISYMAELAPQVG